MAPQTHHTVTRAKCAALLCSESSCFLFKGLIDRRERFFLFSSSAEVWLLSENEGGGYSVVSHGKPVETSGQLFSIKSTSFMDEILGIMIGCMKMCNVRRQQEYPNERATSLCGTVWSIESFHFHIPSCYSCPLPLVYSDP